MKVVNEAHVKMPELEKGVVGAEREREREGERERES